MITAAEALRLPSAQLTEEETRAADALEASIDAFVRQHMTRGSLNFDALETRVSIVTEVQWRIRKAGWRLETLALKEQSRVSGQERIIGYRLVLCPTDEAYRAAEEIEIFASA